MQKKEGLMGKSRVYVCHTYYHVYVACLKELNRTGEEKQGPVTLVLSTMSNDFGNLNERALSSGIFDEVVWFEEKPYDFFEELIPLKKDTGSLVLNMIHRMKFCRRLGQLEEAYVPVDFASYDEIYVFCDSDPIGYYLSYKKIRYHAVEDGLNCIRYRDTAYSDNEGHFGLKKWMARKGWIFIQNGYGKYCIDMEVNDISALDHPIDKMVEVPRQKLVDGLDMAAKEKLISLFIENRNDLDEALSCATKKGKPVVLILTEPLCKDLSVRRKLVEDMIREYGMFSEEECGRKRGKISSSPEENRKMEQGVIVIKPHPRDLLDYKAIFPQYIVLDAKFPMEILNFFQKGDKPIFDRVVTVYTVPSSIHCAREKVYLGNAFMDRYEDAASHASVTDHGESQLRSK